ncbi:hypothetical protein CAAN1_07S06722 [[Candida] anglica]|uniref:Oxidoreductase-like domain-containing protein n=1 Tax=[Candida] anglica TaxID=148631 RepID=A0ABP0EBL2_9ASCO
MIRKSQVVLNKYKFYDLVAATYSHPSEPLEAMKSIFAREKHGEGALDSTTKRASFKGNYQLDGLSGEERIAKIFGGRIKGESPRSSSRILRGEPITIAGVKVPPKPIEPDNCCMSGCVNCVWELFNDDLKDWKSKRAEAAKQLVKKGGRWPENFYAPVYLLNKENLPRSIATDEKKQEDLSKKEDGWGEVPVTIKVFAEMERKLKQKRKQEATTSP